MMKALIVVDMQNDFLTGSLANPDAVAIIPKIKELIKSKEYDTIVFTQDTHFENYLETPEGRSLPIEHCVTQEGWEITKEFEEFFNDDDYYISELRKATFGTIQLADHLDGLGQFDEVTFCGTCTDICVISNALILKAMRPFLTINVKADCCAGVTKEKHEAALEVMKSCLINII